MAADKLEPPKPTRGDTGHTIAKAVLSTVPGIGGPAAELFQYLVQPPLEKRRSEWMEAVGEKLQELKNRGVDIEELGQNEEFISAVMHASQIALRTHQKEKREALRNAVFNVAADQSPGEALESMFFEWIDSLSVLHLQVLRLFQSPEPPPNMSIGSLSSVLEYKMPQLEGQADIYTQVWNDLFSRGLVNTNGLNAMMSGGGLGARRTSRIGDKFLRFVSEPSL